MSGLLGPYLRVIIQFVGFFNYLDTKEVSNEQLCLLFKGNDGFGGEPIMLKLS